MKKYGVRVIEPAEYMRYGVRSAIRKPSGMPSSTAIGGFVL